MKVLTGTVVDGKVEVVGEVQDGVMVAVLAPDSGGYRLTPEQEDELETALAQVRSGDFVDGDDLLAEIRSLSGR